mgnify:CR=1 FL=1
MDSIDIEGLGTSATLGTFKHHTRGFSDLFLIFNLTNRKIMTGEI